MSTIKVDTIATRSGSGNITASNTIAGNLTGNVTGNLTGNSTVGGTLGVTGNTTITSGNLVIATAGNGIDFSAASGSASGSSSALLDDYEEGTFTATLLGDSSGSGTITNGSGGTATCRYTRIGRLVYCELGLILSNLGSISGRVIIGGFPFTAAFFGGQGAVRNQGLGGNNYDGVVFEMNQGAATGRFHFNSSTTTQRSVQHTDATNGDFIGVGITYSV